jgi:hypothetical protein
MKKNGKGCDEEEGRRMYVMKKKSGEGRDEKEGRRECDEEEEGRRM